MTYEERYERLIREINKKVSIKNSLVEIFTNESRGLLMQDHLYDKSPFNQSLHIKTNTFEEMKKTIIDTSKKMLEDEDKRFALRFFEYVNVIYPHIIPEIKSRENRNLNWYNGRIFFIYLIADFYNICHNNYELYDDYISTIKYARCYIDEKMNIYKVFKSIPEFPTSNALMMEFKRMITNQTIYNDSYLLKRARYLKKCYEYMDVLNINKIRLNHYMALYGKVLSSSLTLLLDDRYYKLEGKLTKMERKSEVREKIINIVAEWDCEFFEEATKTLGKDAFDICISNCLDSYTYRELFKKLEKVKEFSNNKKEWDYSDSCNMISNVFIDFFNSLKTKKFQELFKGKKSDYKFKNKSNYLFANMANLYAYEYGSELFDDFEDLLIGDDIDGLYERINRRVESYNKRPILKIKRFLDKKTKKFE